MTIKLHVFPPSPRGFKVLLAANHLGVDYEFCFVDLTKGEQMQPAFAAINPNRKMPALEHGDFKLWESNAIVQYLAAQKPEAGLVPRDERGRADVARWMFWESTTWDPACATLVFERVVKAVLGLGASDPIQEEKGVRDFQRAAEVLDSSLRGRDWLCGERLSLADLSLGAALNAAQMARYPIEPYVEIQRWHARLAALPAWRKAEAMQVRPAAA